MKNTEFSAGAYAPVVDLPPSIQLALARIMGCDGGGLIDLTYRERSLLARVTRNVSVKDPRASVRVSVDTLASALQTCGKTIQRTFNSLRAKGWIMRDQVKCRSGMQIADTWLTTSTLETLGLTRPSSSRAASDNMSGACNLSAMSKDSQQIPGSSDEQPQKKSKIPKDLSLLEELGMKPGAVFKLMGEATEAGHRLGHIVHAVAPLIRAAKFPFGYIRKLICHDRDWQRYTSAAMLRETQVTEAVMIQTQRHEAQATVETALQSGKLLTNAAGKLFWRMLNGVVYACPVVDLAKPESLRSYTRVTDLAKMAEAIRNGRLFEFQRKNE